MSLTKQVAQNTIIQTLGKIIGTIIGVLTVAIMTRYLGQEGFGQYTTIIAFLQFFSLVADLGLYLVLTNEISRPGIDLKNLFNNFFTLRFVSALFFLILVSSIVWIFPYSLIIKQGVIITSLSLFFILLNQILVSLFQKELQMDKVAIGELAGKIIFLGLAFGAVVFKMSLLAILWAVVLGSLINFLIVYFYSRKYIHIALVFNFDFWLRILQKSWPVALSGLFVLVYFKADTLILSLFKTQSEVGIYGAAYKILEVLIAFPALFMGLVSPVLAKTFSEGNKERFGRIFQKSFDFLSLVSWPMVLGTIILSGPIMFLIAGKDFIAASPVLQILIVATGIIFLAHLPGYSIVAIGRQREMVKFYLIAALGALIGYLIFIPIYSYFGAAIITLLVEFFIFFFALKIILKTIKLRLSLAVFGKSFLASLIMSVAIYLLADQNLFFLIILGGLIYFTVLYLLKGISKDIILEIIK
jgi:O-antigen/teichoic acid export membrane protein